MCFWVPWRLVKVYKEPAGRLTFKFSLFDRYVKICFRAGAERIEIMHIAHPERGKVALESVIAIERGTGKRMRLPRKRDWGYSLGRSRSTLRSGAGSSGL